MGLNKAKSSKPESWLVFTIGDLLSNGTIIDQMDGNHGELYPKAHEFSEFGVPYVTANDFVSGRLSFARCKYLSEKRASLFKKGIAKANDVLFAHNATVGPSALLNTSFPYVILSTTATYFRCNSTKLLPAFFLYAIRSDFFLKQIQSVMGQSTRNQVPILAQRKISICLPPTLAEQEAIANALSDADAYIESLEKLIEKKRQIKKGAMQELLTGKRRLPGFSGEWSSVKLGSLGVFLKGSGVKKDEASTGSIPCIRYGEIYTLHENFIRVFNSFISREVASQATEILSGDLLFAGSGETKEEIGKTVSYLGSEKAYAGGDIVILRPKGVSSLFMGYYLNSVDIQAQKASFGQGDAVVHIGANALGQINLKIPSTEEQSAIGAVLLGMEDSILSLEGKLSKARLIKQGMMQELLTGRIRLV